jgi:nitrite reductase/ring-hydroxylating ferredoxin subunit
LTSGRDLSERLSQIVERLENFAPFDVASRAIEPVAQRLTSQDAVKRVLSGTPLGHRLHPLLTDLPIGSWTAASLVDVFAWRSGRQAARRLVAFGILASLPTAATGISDWNDTHGGTRRLGVAHMAANGAALAFEIASWRARGRGHHVRGALLGVAGLGALTAGGYLGGHLVFVQRAGVNAEVPTITDDAWHTVCRTDELVDGEPIGVAVDGVRIAVIRNRGFVYALAGVCSHAGGPLDRGKVRGDSVVCPWHGSAFCLPDGAVERGPATTPEPVYETRVRGDLVEVRRPTHDHVIAHAIV